MALASYTKPGYNTLANTLTVCLTNSFTSIFSSIIIFSIVGFRAVRTNTDPELVCCCLNIHTKSDVIQDSNNNIEQMWLKFMAGLFLAMYSVIMCNTYTVMKVVAITVCSISRSPMGLGWHLWFSPRPSCICQDLHFGGFFSL